jgi:hypothetical protein
VYDSPILDVLGKLRFVAVQTGRVTAFEVLGLSGSSPEVHVRDLRVFCPKVARLAYLVSRESHDMVTRPTFGQYTRRSRRRRARHGRKPNVFVQSIRRAGDALPSAGTRHGTLTAPSKKKGT